MSPENPGRFKIALRTFRWSYDPGVSKLYVWTWNGSSWANYGSGYPLDIPNGVFDYSNPCYIGDINGNGAVELALSAGTERLWLVEINSPNPTCVEQNLSPALDPDTTYDWNLGTSMLTSVDQGGYRYLVGTARDGFNWNPPAGEWLVYCYRLNNNLTGTMAWTRGDGGALTPGISEDHWGNFGGLAIGDLSSNSGLELIQQWDRYRYAPIQMQSVRSYSLSNGIELSSMETTRNPHQEDPCLGPVVIGGSISGYGAALFGYSNLGHAVRMNSGNLEYIAGFPYWTEDLGLSAPVVSDVDGDGLLEALMVDDSGLMQLFDWNAAAGSGGWPTFQHDNWRTGYYGTSVPNSIGSCPDVAISMAELAVMDETTRTSSASLSRRYVRALVEITCVVEDVAVSVCEQGGQASVPIDGRRSVFIGSPTGSRLSVGSFSGQQRVVEVEVLASDGSILGHAEIRLENGTHELRIPLGAELPVSCHLAVAVDPSNKLAEADEGNNTCALDAGSGRADAMVGSMVTRDGRVVVTLAPQSTGSDREVSVSLYSLDGRLVEQVAIEAGGLQISLPSSGDALPSGCYMVVVEQGDTEFTQKVVVLR